MRFSTFVLTSCLMSLAAIASAQTLVPTGRASESLFDAAKISGQIVAGFGFEFDASTIRPAVTVFIPSEWGGETVCLETTSQDGRYVSNFEYTVDIAWGGGFVEVPLVTNHSNYLEAQDPKDLAAFLSNAECGIGGSQVAPVAWNEGVDLSSRPRMYVRLNSLRADEVILLYQDGSEQSCVPVTRNQRLAFDFECEIPNRDALEVMEEIEVLRMKSGRIQPPAYISLVVPQ